MWSIVTAKIRDVYPDAGRERRAQEVEDILKIINDAYCDKHLLNGRRRADNSAGNCTAVA